MKIVSNAGALGSLDLLIKDFRHEIPKFQDKIVEYIARPIDTDKPRNCETILAEIMKLQ